MEKIQIKTLMDVTNTRVIREIRGKELQHNQYKNWTTLLQCIGLRCIITFDEPAVCEFQDVRAQGFGEKHRGEHNVWSFIFYTDRDQAYATEKSPIGFLISDVHEVPVIEKLTETINMNRPVFDTQSRFWRNTVIKLI